MALDGAVLEVADLSKKFGGLVALDGLSLTVTEGALFGLIGPNGSGKTTAFNLISGVLRPSRGRILFRGQDITAWPAHRNAALGMARTFQNIRLFKELPVLDNIAAGLHMRHGPGLWPTLLALPGARRAERRIADRAEEILEMIGLSHRARLPVESLPYGEQRRVELGRALATEPKLLLLDEPSAGMNAAEKVVMAGTIRQVQKRFGLAVILVEHDMKMVMGLCDWITVINQGQLLAAGRPEEIQAHPKVIEAYLGRKEARRHA